MASAEVGGGLRLELGAVVTGFGAAMHGRCMAMTIVPAATDFAVVAPPSSTAARTAGGSAAPAGSSSGGGGGGEAPADESVSRWIGALVLFALIAFIVVASVRRARGGRDRRGPHGER